MSRTTRVIGVSAWPRSARSEEHTSELQSLRHLVCRLLLEKKKKIIVVIVATAVSSSSSPPSTRAKSHALVLNPTTEAPGSYLDMQETDTREEETALQRSA